MAGRALAEPLQSAGSPVQWAPSRSATLDLSSKTHPHSRFGCAAEKSSLTPRTSRPPLSSFKGTYGVCASGPARTIQEVTELPSQLKVP